MNEQNQQLSKADRRRLRNERRQKRKEAERKKRNRQKMVSRSVWILAGVIFVVGIGLLSTRKGEPTNEQKIKNQGNVHIESTNTEHEAYTSYPPTSGPHVGNIAGWGIHGEEIPNELQIHNLEDGGVIIQYNPDRVSGDEISQLETIVSSSDREHIILAPYANMDYKIAVTAWNRLLDLDNIDAEQINAFVKKYEGVDHHNRTPGF